MRLFQAEVLAFRPLVRCVVQQFCRCKCQHWVLMAAKGVTQ